MLRTSSLLTSVCLSLVVFVFACSSSSGTPATTPCNDAPFTCASGQTCWLNAGGSAFECLNSVAGVTAGASCEDTVGAPTCGDAQLCFQSTSTGSGICVAYCDPSSAAHGCPSGYTCRGIEVENNMTLEAFVCVPPASTAQDAGTPDSSSGGDATSD